MATHPHKLLVLKAFYLGQGIAKKGTYVAPAVAMVDAAIAFLEPKQDETSRVRLLFYVLLKAEILRSNPSVADLRSRARNISRAMGSEMFDEYMAVEEETQTRVRAGGIQKGVIADQGIRTTETFLAKYGSFVKTEVVDYACKALGIRSLSDKEFHFVHKTSLKELLEKHGVPFSI
ncbi:hypothetical protein [Marinobacter subterrani]|uniref:Uncharacterized protein n=1 Tax=Marinobacter subterrani TaxID=1658765 RepID=A0A0J7JFG1_9GAMM|nr:hypothetical protein [Marinobacter subterrani]KMQ76907.1 hypothetical protein Msub_13121 [Marinobacter subterrani]